jgi:hypothetical protein
MGLSHCLRNRWLSNDIYGSGLANKSLSVPLATGLRTHEALENLLLWCKDQQDAGKDPDPPDEIVRDCIETSISKYETEVDECPLADVAADSEEIDVIVEEQSTLLGGLTWCWRLTRLPWILQDWNILAVEEEFELILNCTCGLENVGTPDIHQERGCNGIVLMTRPDLMIEHKESDLVAYVEFKTEAYVDKEDYPDKYYDNVQLALSCAAAERVLDKKVDQIFVHGMSKGGRRGNYNSITKKYESPKRQQSPLCYSYYKPENPPMWGMDVSPNYYKIVDGQRWGCSKGRGYEKKGVWEIPFDTDLPKYEYYTKECLTEDERASQIRVVGPLDHPGFLVEKLLREMAAFEENYREKVDYVEEIMRQSGSYFSEECQEALDETLPRSWDCFRYNGHCAKNLICFEKNGWDDPLTSNKFELRQPNHPIEDLGKN